MGSDAGYQLVLDRGWSVDVQQLEQLMQQHPPPGALVALLEGGGGRPLGDLADEDWARPLVTRWTGLQRRARLMVIDHRLDRGEAEELLPALQTAVADDPLHEPTWSRYLLALYRAGRQAEALRAFGRLRQILGEELGIEPSAELTELEERILLQDPSLDAPTSTPTNLPAPLVQLVGRTDDVASVDRLLTEHRLVTITGAGGCGKTTLALEVARPRLPVHPDGVWWFELAPFTSGSEVVTEMLGAMGITNRPDLDPLESLTDAVRHRRLLLVLDNCEHLVDEIAPVVGRLLRRAPHAKALTTSRRPLGISGEVTWQLPPLSVPEEGADPETILASEAALLFSRRALPANQRFERVEHIEAVARVCRRLDGLPLALELAAARVRGLGIVDVERRLDDRFQMLVGGDPTQATHHQTLMAAIDWSTDLLSDQQRRIYQRLSVFPGSFDLSAAEAVAGEAAVEVLDALVQHSLLTTVPSEEQHRYRMLESTREHARQQLRQTGDEDQAMAALLGWVANLTREGAPKLEGPDQVAWLRRFRLETDTIRAVLGWAASHDPVTGVAVTAGIARFWWPHATDQPGAAHDAASFLIEGRDWMYRLLDAAEGAVPAKLRARALTSLGGLLEVRTGDFENAVLHLEEAIQLLEELDDSRSLGWAVFYRMIAGFGIDEPAHTLDGFRRSLTLHRAAEDRFGVAVATLLIGLTTALFGNPAEGRPFIERFAAGAHKSKVPWLVGHADDALAMIDLMEGKTTPEVGEMAGSAIETFQKMGNFACTAHAVGSAAILCVTQGRLEEAAQILGVVEGIRDRLSMVTAPYEDRTPIVERMGLESLAPELREQRFAEGRALDPDEGIELALSVLEGSR